MAPKNPPPSKKRTRSPSSLKTCSSTAKKGGGGGGGKAASFLNRIRKRNLHLERGIDLPAVDQSIAEEVKRRNWTKYVAHPTKQFNVTLVQEFFGLIYGNGTDKTTTSVEIRGVTVDFSPAAIMKHLGIPDFPVEEHYEFVWDLKDSSKKSAKVMEAQNFLDRNAIWDQGRFDYYGVSSVAKVWSYFVNSCLIPSSHFQSINRKEALAIYAILTKTPIHVGYVIHKAIIKYVTKEEGRRKIPFPNTIAAMVVAAKVPRGPADQISQTTSPIIGARLIASSSSSSAAATAPAPPPKPQRKQVYLSDIEDLRADIAALRSDIHAGFERQRVWADDWRIGIRGVRSVVDGIAHGGASFDPDAFPRMSSTSTPCVYEPWAVPPPTPNINATPTVPSDEIEVEVPPSDSPLPADSTLVDMFSVDVPVTLIDNPEAPCLVDSSVMLAAQVLTEELHAAGVPLPGDDETAVDDAGLVDEEITPVDPSAHPTRET